METKKISETQLEVTKEVIQPAVVTSTTTVYNKEFIENQIIEITKQRDEMIRVLEDTVALKKAELLECQNILNEMDKQGIITPPVEETTLQVDKTI